MSYIYAKTDALSINGDDYEVKIIVNAAGTDLDYNMALSKDGFALTYESENDVMLLPGIMHGRCTITTVWLPADFTRLESLLNAITTSADGDYLMEVTRNDERVFTGTILAEEINVDENSGVREARFVASDGISLLKNVDYNNAGTAYTGYQTIWAIIQNIQEKWLLYDYYDNNQSFSSNYRIQVVQDVYSEDDFLLKLLPHPAGTQYNVLDRSRIHTNPWSKTNNAGTVEYINCYDLLQSICLTYQFRLYCYENGWQFIPLQLADETSTGYYLNWGGGTGTAVVVNTWDYQLADIQKASGWARTFTPQVKHIALTRDANNGATILSAVNADNDDVLIAANTEYAGVDTEDEQVRYVVTGRLYVSNTAVSVPSADDDVGRLVVSFVIAWNPDSTIEYYNNTLEPNVEGGFSLAQFFNGQGSNYTELLIHSPEYSATEGRYHLELTDDNFYTPSVPGSRAIDFFFAIPPPQTTKTGLKIVPRVEAYQPNGTVSATLNNALTEDFITVRVEKWSGDELELMNTFDYVASSTTGLDRVNIGTSYIGGLGASMGRIDVETAPGVYGTSDNYVNQASNDARPINELCVEEILALHTRPSRVERGSIVFRGATTPPRPYSRFNDRDTGIYYTATNWTLRSTPCEVDVTLRQIGRNAISITTDYENTGRIPDVPPTDILQAKVDSKPNIMFSYNNDARSLFAGDWSAVIGTGETKEMYFTTSNDGQGKYIESQGDSPAVGNVIVRTVYVNTRGLQERTDSGWTSPAALQPAQDGTLEDAIDKMRNYINKIADHGSFTFMVTYKETSSFTGILDTYTTASAAYSTRRLSSTYTGSLLRIRRADGTEQDIGYVANGDLDTSAITTFAGGTSCTVKIWYDQSGNSNDLINTTVSTQPEIYTGSVLYTIGGATPTQRYAINFTSDYLSATADLHSGAFYAVSAVVTGSTIGNLHIFNQDDSGTGGTARVGQYLRTGSANNTARCVVFSTDGTSTADNTANNTVAANTAYVISSHGKSSQVEAFVDNTSNGHTSVATALRHGSALYRVGATAHNTTPALFWNGRIAEVIMFDEDMSGGSQTGVVSNIDTYFNI